MKDSSGLLHKSIQIELRSKSKKLRVLCLHITFCFWLIGNTQPGFCQGNTASFLQRKNSEATFLQIDFKDGLLSINAKQAPMEEVLHKIRNKARILIHSSIPLKKSVTLSFTAFPVKEAVARLFGQNVDFVFRYPIGAQQLIPTPEEIWVIGSDLGQDTQQLQTTVSKSNGTQASHSIDFSEDEIDPKKIERHDIEENDKLIEKAAHDENAEERARALASLSGQGQTIDKKAELALEAALADKDPSVRGYAVQALANQRGQESTELLRQALQDPDSGVRILAVESVVPKDQGIDLLHEALANTDVLVQAIAADRLKQVAQKSNE